MYVLLWFSSVGGRSNCTIHCNCFVWLDLLDQCWECEQTEIATRCALQDKQPIISVIMMASCTILHSSLVTKLLSQFTKPCLQHQQLIDDWYSLIHLSDHLMIMRSVTWLFCQSNQDSCLSWSIFLRKWGFLFKASCSSLITCSKQNHRNLFRLGSRSCWTALDEGNKKSSEVSCNGVYFFLKWSLTFRRCRCGVENRVSTILRRSPEAFSTSFITSFRFCDKKEEALSWKA